MSKQRLWTTICLICAFGIPAVIGSAAQTFKILVGFDVNNGKAPQWGALVQGFNGNLYGTTYYGGTHSVGTIFVVTAAGRLRTLHSFDTTDGAYPTGGLVQATNGNLYGTTTEGGTDGYGTVFQITPAGTLTRLHSFDNTDGAYPHAGLVQGANGILYGVTYQGGTKGGGTVFQITTAGALHTLLDFDGSNGAFPVGTLIQATNGNLYGTTSDNGAHNGGTVFDISITGTPTLHTIYNFCLEANCTDGLSPWGGLVQASNGNFYGTTRQGGADNAGVIFDISAAGKFNRLLSFDSTNGSEPYDSLIQATDGNFYGTTSSGGGLGDGTIFEFSSAGKLTTLLSFDLSNGYVPYASLLQATTGTFYGTTESGGNPGYGTVYSLSEGLGPFVDTLPTSRAVGASVVILGNNLTGATSVTFNGKAATFKVVSSTEITTTVPTGATTGKVQVKTPSATLTSNVNFQVT